MYKWIYASNTYPLPKFFKNLAYALPYASASASTYPLPNLYSNAKYNSCILPKENKSYTLTDTPIHHQLEYIRETQFFFFLLKKRNTSST